MVEEGNNEEIQLDESLFMEEEQQAPEPDPQPQASEQEEDVPEKYRGKSAMEIIRMHQDAERLLGKQGNEVGELRKIVDDIVASTPAQTSKAPTPPEEDNTDWFVDPKGATAKAAREVYSTDPELQAIKQSYKQMQQRTAAEELLRRHPDAAKLSNDPNFGSWVSKSKLRQNLFLKAHNEFDYESAAELFDLYKETKAYNKDVAEAATSQRKQSVKNAAVGSGKASSEARALPTLSREAIVKLRIEDPERYNQMLPKLKEMYRAGRAR